MRLRNDIRKAVRVARVEGRTGVADRLVRAAARRFGSAGEQTGLAADDVVDASSTRVPPRRARAEGGPLEVGWVITPPAAGSGGHTTAFRMVQAMEAAGHRCLLFLYDPHGGALADHERVIRTWWPGMRAEVRSVADGLPDLDAHVATAWTTAHVLARHDRAAGARFYLVQDFEPYFYARGSAAALAEETYSFGFQVLAVGHMVAGELRDRFGLDSTVLPFGCDHGTYRVTGSGPRDEVVFYARPGVPRRGYELGVAALELFTRARPDVVVNTFGVQARHLPFPARVHAAVPPARLNELYNRCAAGLALSFTNVSLVAFELLAAGVVPVVNDGPGPRADLDSPFVEWARPTPAAVAAALTRAVDGAAGRPAGLIAASVADTSWRPAERAVVDTIERSCVPVA
ncbi:hypothetical protein SAMN05660359_00799 [Geodermatophilus obscurus]|uniref:Uncharacterized protein n=1 Tax=Geodermatophilus obscurus TaxID=1861 RepID=A0A1I5DI06_9ACTN|nr:glycosyltransferase family 1 protein [Geodermatophilus obscurus]SFN98894.1 hypothetical protein SAMN05660359_00799 [Geodermatophilus obscurus]